MSPKRSRLSRQCPFTGTTNRRTLLSVFAGLLASASTAVPAGISKIFEDNARTVGLAAYDDSTGVLTIARNAAQSDVEWKYVNVRRYGSFFDGKFLTAADLNGDGGQEVILPGYAANKVLVIWSHSYGAPELEVETLDVGPGPEAIATGQLDSTPEHEAIVANTAVPGAGVSIRSWNFKEKKPITGPAEHPGGFALNGLLGFETVGSARGAANPFLGILRHDSDDGENPSFTIFARHLVHEYGPGSEVRSWKSRSGHTLLISGHPDGETQSGWFLAYAPGTNVLELFPSGPGTNELITLSSGIRSVQFIPEPDDEVLVLFENGDAEIFDFTPGNGFNSLQLLNPPPGMDHALSKGGYLTFFRVGRDGGEGAAHAVFEKIGGEYIQTSFQQWPDPPVFDNEVTVVLYTGDPFSAPPPFPFETFLAGDWASAAFYSNGTVMASVETFGGIEPGLGNAMPQSLNPANDPGPGGVALGNQWEPSSSLFYNFAAGADGIASVTINPPAGSYANTVGATFQTGADVTAHYRINQGSWLTGSGPVWLTQDATVEYYGEHSGGALSSIHTAAYEIDQLLSADSDGDFVPDAIEALAGSNPFNPDSDGDGVDDFSEILGDSDPNDPSSQVAKTDSFALKQVLIRWDDTNSAALPAFEQDLFVTDWEHQHESTAARSGDFLIWQRGFGYAGSASAIEKYWLPANFRIETGELEGPNGAPMTSFGGIGVAPRVEIPFDPGATDPLAAWKAAAQDAVDAHSAEPLEFTIGPASTMAALIFEYWYGMRLVELGRLPSLADRPRLADTRRSLNAGVPLPDDLAAVQTPQEPQLTAHDLAHVTEQISSNVVTESAFQPLRDTAEAIYAQAVAANRDGMPLDSPIDALRMLISGMTPPAGYTSPHAPATIQNLRNQALAAVMARPVLQLTGTLSFINNGVAVESLGIKYLLFKPDGTPLRASAATGGAIVEGTIANVLLFLLPGTLPGEDGGEVLFKGEIVSIEPTFVPGGSDTDIDGNGIPDSWQFAFLGTLGTPFGNDTDGDGYLDPEEYAAGSDPDNPFSTPSGVPATPAAFSLFVGPDGKPVVEWDGAFSANYQLQFTTGFDGWQPQPGLQDLSGDRRHTVVIETPPTNAFFRLLTTIPLP